MKRRAALLWIAASTAAARAQGQAASALAQGPAAAAPAPPLPPPTADLPGAQTAQGALGAQSGLLPHNGNLPNPPASSAASRMLNLPTVSIREFRSSVGEIAPRGATDMFIAALVKTRKFRVLERARLADGIASEKALNQQGMTTGQAGQSQYAAATYLFEGTVSEASVNDKRSAFTLGVAGAAAERGSAADSIAIDVRVVDVESGLVVEAVGVRKQLLSVENKVGGVTSALANLLTRGRGGAVADALAPSDAYVSARKDSADKALREAIEEAVNLIAKRLVDGP